MFKRTYVRDAGTCGTCLNCCHNNTDVQV